MTSSIPLQIEAIKRHFNSECTRPLSWRRAQLLQLKAMIEENEQLFLQALHDDLHKPAMEAWSTELAFVTGDIDHCLSKLKSWAKPRRVKTPIVGQPGRSYIQPEPLGTVLIIGAWNYPVQLTLSPLVAAISAGNCAVIKPSELSVATSNLLAKLLKEYLDPKAFVVIEGGVDETTELLEQPFDHILYTGSARVGRIVMQAAAKHLTPVTLELGGKSPIFVDDSCQLKITAQRIAWGKFLNAGQTCLAPDYILTTASMRDKLVAALRAEITNMYTDQPKQSDSYGRIVNVQSCQRLAGFLGEGEIVVGGQYDIDDCYVEPTLLLDPDVTSSVMQEEIFGPILPIITVDSFGKAVEFVQARDKPLASYIFTTNTQQQQDWVSRISSGSQCINDTFMFTTVPELPFGGVGNSGMGQYSGSNGFKRLSHMKAIMKRPNISDLAVRFAPYSPLKFKLLRWIR